MSLPIAWVLKDKHILLVGGGEVAETRIRKLVPEEAKVVVVAPTLTPHIQELADKGEVRWLQRNYEESDLELEHWSFVLTAIDEHDVSKEIAHACRSRHIPVNVADVIPLCDFYFGANFQQGPLKVMVSTGSSAPRLSKRVLNELAHHAAEFQFADAITKVSKIRSILRMQLPGGDPKVSQTRMLLMKTLCDKLTFPELAAIKEEEMVPMIRGMLLSTAACPAHPIGDVDNAEDFVGDIEPSSAKTDERAQRADGKQLKKKDASDSESSESSESSENSESNESSTDESESDSSSGVNTSASEDQIPKENDGLAGSMKRKAIECAQGFPRPKIPAFPYPRGE